MSDAFGDRPGVQKTGHGRGFATLKGFYSRESRDPKAWPENDLRGVQGFQRTGDTCLARDLQC